MGRKRIYISLLAMVMCAIGLSGQPLSVPNYDSAKAKRVLYREFSKGDFWLMPTDTSGVCFFSSKKEASKLARIKVVPTYKVIKSDNRLVLIPDYTVYVGLLFKLESFLGVLNVWKNQTSKRNELEIALVDDPPPGFLQYTAMDSAGYVLDDNAFLIFENGIGKTWSHVSQSYVTYLPDERKEDPALSKVSPETILASPLDSVKYRIRRNIEDSEWLLKFQSKNDTIVVSITERIPTTELFRNWVVFKDNKYSLEYGGFRWIYNSNHDILVSYLPESGSIDDLLSDSHTDFEIVELKTGTGFKFIESSTNTELLTARYIKTGVDEYLMLNLRIWQHSELLQLTAALVCWERFFQK